MDRVKYNSCISSHLKGKKFSREERKLEFCISSKLCSGKSSNRDEAIRICNQPQDPNDLKSPKRHRAKGMNIDKMSRCLVGNIDLNKVNNPASVEQAFADALTECQNKR